MPFDIETVFNYFWLLAIVVNALNALIFWRRAQSDIKTTPTLKAGYIKLIRGFFLGMSIPWVVMGLGMTFGGINTIADYFYPREGNQFIVAWWISIWALLLFFSYWLWFNGGAETLVKYPAFLRNRRGNTMAAFWRNPKVIRWYWLIVVLGSLVAHVFIWTMEPR